MNIVIFLLAAILGFLVLGLLGLVLVALIGVPILLMSGRDNSNKPTVSKASSGDMPWG